MCKKICVGLLLGFTFALATGASADCKVQSRSENLILMNCQPGLPEEKFKEIGRDSCGEDRTCNVWFWEGNEGLPEVAPIIDSELPKSLTSSAVAVWVNDSDSLLKLKKVK